VKSLRLEYRMRDRPDDLIFAIVISILLIVLIDIAPDSPIRSIIGLFFLLVLPGYVTICAFSPQKGKMDFIERIAISLGLSISIFSLLALSQYFILSGIDFDVLEFLLVGFVVFVAFIAWQRRMRLPEDERYEIDVSIGLSLKGVGWADRLLLVGIVIAASVSIILMSMALTAPSRLGEYTEMGLLGPTGQTGGYPMNITVDQKAKVNISVTSHEASESSYNLIILLQPKNNTGANITHWREGDPFTEIQSLDGGLAMAYNFTLNPSESLNRTYSFSVEQNGTFKLRFMLFEEGQDIYGQPTNEVWLWLNIRS